MPNGYNGKILSVDLSRGKTIIEKPKDIFYRKYLGGRGFVAYYLLEKLRPQIDPLSPENILIFAAGPITGVPVGGSGRNAVGAKSPLTNALGTSEAGGYWGAELKHAGFDAIVIYGKSEKPAFIWINDERVEIRDATHLWGKTTGESHKIICQELGDHAIRTTLIGPAGEKLVRYACILNDLTHAAGRTGMGAVMGSKNLKAIAVRGHKQPALANPQSVREIAKALRGEVEGAAFNVDLQVYGTGASITKYSDWGKLPTYNFQEGSFPGAERITAQQIKEHYRVGMASCFACPVRCKKVVRVDNRYKVDSTYGGPEYETLASFGSNCGIDDLEAICKANEICNAYGMDTLDTGGSISFAMECFQKGLLTKWDTGGIDLSFGNAEAMVEMVKMICSREGFGDLLAEGSLRAAQRIGKEAISYAMQVKGQGLPMHEPRYAHGQGLGYGLSPTGADHNHNIHDYLFTDEENPMFEHMKAFGILEPMSRLTLSTEKVRTLLYWVTWRHMLNSLVLCQFPSTTWDTRWVDNLVNAVTGWNTSVWELMKVGERCANMMRAFNLREGFCERDDTIPARFFGTFTSESPKGTPISTEAFNKAKKAYYAMSGWDPEEGKPTLGKLWELDIEWVAAHLPSTDRAR